MKKKHLLGFLFSMLSFMFVSACNSPTSINVNFKDNEYVLSLNESIDFFEEFNLNGKEAALFDLVSADEEIVDETEEGVFVAKTSGETYIKATFKGSVVAQVKVKVKYKFSSPSNLKIDESGKLTWSKSSVMRKDKEETARQYKLSYALIENGVVGEVTTKTVGAVYESLQHLPKGVYQITIQALSHSNDYDNSDEVQQNVNYGAMGQIENVVLTNESLGGEATLTWDEKDSAVYDIYIEGFNVAKDLEEESFSHNFSIYPTAQTIKVEVIAKPTGDKQAIETSTRLNITKLTTPSVSVSNGIVQMSQVNGASGYVITGDETVGTIEIENQTFDFAGFDAGIYSFSALASGSKVKEDGLYINSDLSTELTIGKMPLPSYSIDIEGSEVKISFEKPVFNGQEFDAYYKISCKGMSVVVDSKTSAGYTLNTAIFPVGSYDVSVELLPQAGVSMTDENGQTTNLLVKSDPVTKTFYKLDQFGEVTHSLEGTTSTISFDKIRYATDYQLSINDVLYTETTFVEEDGMIKFVVENLDKKIPNGNKYTFKIVAFVKNGDDLVSTIASTTKVLEILPSTAVAYYPNGFYYWQPVRGAIYDYEVYETDKTGTILPGQAEPVLWENGTTNFYTKEALRSGYYLINVYIKSSDTDKYLDANFYQKDIVLTGRFNVTTIIDTPEFVFLEEDGKYKLDITSVEYGGKYDIYVDGTLVGEKVLQSEIWNEENPGHVEYEFDVDFATSKNYTISVAATAGAIYDTAIHIGSSTSSINLTRVAQTEIGITLGKDFYGRIINQIITAQAPANVVDIKAYRGEGADRTEVLVGYDASVGKYWLDLADINAYGSDFSLYFVNQARNDEVGNYFIDSVEKKIVFQRLATPTNVEYNNGILSFDNNDSRTRNYAINITIISASGEQYFYTFEHGSTSLNLQDKVEQLCASDMAFKTAFQQMEYLSVNVAALQSQNISGIWVLPSFESASVQVEDLSAVTLAFDWNTKTLSWTGGVEGGKYDLYINNAATPAMVDLTNTQITLAEITGLNLTTVQEINVVSKHSKYFDSKVSNSIKVKQLESIKQVDITKNDDIYKATLIIPSDNTSVDKIIVDTIEMPLAADGASVTFDINLTYYAAGYQYLIVSKAKETPVDGVYYLNSEIASFTCKEVDNININRNTSQKIIWSDPVKDVMKGNSANPYLFQITFKDGNVEATITTDKTELSADEIETLFNLDLDDNTGEFEIYAKVIFVQNYTLDLTQEAVALIGEKVSTVPVKPHKLVSVNDVEYEVVDKTASSWVDKKLGSAIKFTFTDHWSNFSDAMLHVEIDNSPINMKLQNTSVPNDYSLEKNGSIWTLTIHTSKHFKYTSNNVKFYVTCAGQVTSDERTLTIKRFSKVGEISISPEGILSIDDAQEGATYAIELDFGGSIQSSRYSQEEISAIDFSGLYWLGGFTSGDYIVSVVAYDAENKIIPSREAQTFTAHQYTGITDVYIDDHGKIALSLNEDSFDGAIFSAKRFINGKTYVKEIVPVQEEPDSGKFGYKFTMTITELMELFQDDLAADGYEAFGNHTFSFTVRGEGGANSQWMPLSFTYSTEDVAAFYGREDYNKDYIVFKDLSSENQTTIAFKVDVSISKDNGGAQSTQEKTVYYYGLMANSNLNLIKGYWIESATNGNHFSITDDSATGDYVEQCYAISLNDLLQEYDYGSYAINVARVCVDDGDNYTQYQTLSFSGYKLNEISASSLRVRDGYNLTWSWSKKDLTDGAVSAGAYYVIVDDGTNVKKFKTSLALFDLRTCGLSANSEYTVSVIAINSRGDVIASNANQFRHICQYSTPTSLVVKDGVLGFDISSTLFSNDTLFGDAIAAVLAGGNPSDFQEMIGKTYTTPYTETLENYGSVMVKLTFTTINSDESHGRRYDITMPAVDLIMDCNIPIINVSLKETFKSYIGNLGATNIGEFANAFINSGEGLSSSIQLFDDKGTAIPKGVYEVSMVQLGKGDSIESMPTAAKRIYLSPAPRVEINQETFNAEANQFTITVTPNAVATTTDGVKFTEIGSENYLMYLRSETANTIVIQLQYNNAAKTWSASYEGTDLNNVNGIIIETLASENEFGIRSFKMNISKLRLVLNGILAVEDQILAGTIYEVDILAPSTDDGVLNGKSGEFTLTYQDIDPSKLKVENGEISLQADFRGELIARYAYKISPNTTGYINVESGKLKLSDIANSGNLAYLSLAIKGSYSYNSIKVESEIYGFFEPYKLSTPDISSINNNLRITYSLRDLDASVTGSMNGDISYVVENNNGGKYISNITQNNVDYTAGLAEKDDVSNEFYAYLNGNSGALAATLEDGEYFKYRLVFAEDNSRRLVLRSEKSTIQARMLDYQAGVSQRGVIDGGHLKLTIPTNDTSEIVNSSNKKVQTLYRVKIDYYQNQDAALPELMLNSQTLYFTKDYVQGNILSVDGEYISKAYDYAKVSVTSVVGLYQDAQDITANSIQAVNGKYFLVSDSFTYADGSYVLASRTYNSGKLLHTNPAEVPSAASGKQTLFAGKFNFVIDKTYMNSNKLYVIANTGDGQKIKLEGSFSFANIMGQSDKAMVTFVPDDFEEEKLQALKGNSFTIQILTYDTNTLISEPLVINSVYKLPDLDGKYEVKVRENIIDGQVTGYETYVDFQKYFDSFKVSGSNSFYQIKVTVTQIDVFSGEEYEWTRMVSAVDKEFTMNDQMLRIKIQAIDSQAEETINRIGVINSDTLNVVVRQTEYQNPVIEWDNEGYQFTWVGGDPEEEYEFYYKASIRQTYNTVETAGVVSTNVYQPQKMGNITQFLVYARNKALTVGEDKVIYLFSESAEAPTGTYAFNIFASGDGTAANPYLIQSVHGNNSMTAKKQFLSIAKRNNEGVYFKLMENIELSISELEGISTFNANLIGNSKTITINAEESYAMPSNYEFKFNLQSQQKTFTIKRYVSLFHTIGLNATVRDLKLNCTYDLELAGNSYIVSPLCVFNYGKIDNVTTIGNKLSLDGNTSNSVLMTGIVGINYGSLNNCKNQSASLDYVAQDLEMVIMYAGIVGQNTTTKYLEQDLTGMLFGCENSAEINFYMNRGTFYVGGIAISNRGNLFACANTGNISCRVSNMNTGNFYIGGIAVHSTSGQVVYCYNSGTIKTENATSTLIGGVITSLHGGTIKGIVDMKANTIVGYCSSANASEVYSTGGTVVGALNGKVSVLEGNKTISGNVTFRGTNIGVELRIVNQIPSYNFSY